ncbi:protein artichoke isoform X2 [Zootermopsis nevadensis]|uniref:Chaoptin n=1 Tax=Zootermopsis nevadensis TaxID=136037 RepID=A0A067R7C0_ZOONE|nr:protein artichoke isoform X2 [Zootermopsis nevadensis]KDR19221.1 Chaoptin [Zootermopsis nevadensis]
MTTMMLVLLLAPLMQAGYVPPGPLYRCPVKPLLLFPCECEAGGDSGLIIRCENSNLASLSVGVTNLAAFDTPVELLTFSKCHIRRLYGSMLYPLRVRVLRIEDTPLQHIEEYSFLGVNRTLQELHIVRSELQEFPTLAFQVLGNVTTLRIDGHQFRTLAGDAFSSGLLPSRLERLHITNGLLSELPPDAFQALRKLKTLDLHGNELKELRRNQFKGLRDTEALDLSHNNLTKVDSSHLADLNKMSWCNLSHNAIPELTRGMFARNTVLRVLHMDHNRLRRLDTNSFRGMRFIRRLYFSDNQIADVGRGTFGSVTRVGTVDLARNFIKKIDFQMFHQLQYVELIDVSENLVTEVHKLAFKDLYLVRINLSHNAIEKIEAGAFENCANVTFLDLSHNKLQNISRTAFDANTYATELDVSYNQLTDLSQVPLHNMTGLKILNASHNAIEKVPRNTFPKLYELHTVDLSYNRIREVWNSVFQTLFSLRFLNMSHNALNSVKGSTFGALHTLLDLDLSHNELSEVNNAALARCASLRVLTLRNNSLTQIFQLPISLGHLDLSNNSISHIPPLETWPTMNALLSLDLSHNAIGDSLERGAFLNLLTLQKLNLEGNGMTRVPWESMSELSTLQFLYMQHNLLTKLERGAFGRLPVVFELNLAHNLLNNITSRAFEGLLQLLTLNLTANNLTTIPNGAFQGLVSLRTLDLSHNLLEKLDNKTHGLLDDCLSLERVNLSHNKISFVTRQTFPSSPWVPYRLREVDLSYNAMPVLTYDITVGTRRMEVLNVSHNILNEIRHNVLGNLTSVRVLDLSHNELTAVTRLPRNLTNLYAQHNLLTVLPLTELLSLKPQLRVVDVRANRLQHFHHELMPLVENGTHVLYSGNPLSCDCEVRPLRQWLASQVAPDPEWGALQCSAPQFLEGKPLVMVPEDRMTCDAGRDGPRFEINPDVKFRDVQRTGDGVSITWFVSTRSDVADFRLVAREAERVVLELDLPYSARSHVVQGLPSSLHIELCLLARDSAGNVRHWRASQCIDLPPSGSYSHASAHFTSVICYVIIFVSLHPIIRQ